MKLVANAFDLMKTAENEPISSYVFIEKGAEKWAARFLIATDDEGYDEDPDGESYLIFHNGIAWVDFLEIAIVQDIKAYVDKRTESPSEQDYLKALLTYDDNDSL